MFFKDTDLPSPENALPGRATEVTINNVHFITGAPLKPPFEQGLQTAIFAMGCFWGAERRFWQQPGVVSSAVGYAGGKTPKHDHHGLEYTVVLKGSFSDENAVYREGDFLVRQPGDVHQPMGAQNGECICLSALSAPIKLTNPLGFLMKPWLRINPM